MSEVFFQHKLKKQGQDFIDANFMQIGIKFLEQGGEGKRRGLGPRNDVLTTCKVVTLRDGQRIITAFFPQ